MNTNKMKNKYFLPIVLLSIVVIVVSIFSISRVNKQSIGDSEVNDETEESIINFSWEEGDKPVLLMSASEEVSIGALDLYIGYKNVNVIAVTNMGELPEPAFSRVSSDNSLVVLNYLISEDDGFKISPGQSIKIAELDISLEMLDGAELFIDGETDIVDNDTVKGLPYKSENLIIKSTL